MLSGVLQGSVLESILFLIYVNDVPSSVLNSKLLLFADVAKPSLWIYIANIISPTDVTLLQEDLTIGASTTFLILMSINCKIIIKLSYRHQPAITIQSLMVSSTYLIFLGHSIIIIYQPMLINSLAYFVEHFLNII